MKNLNLIRAIVRSIAESTPIPDLSNRIATLVQVIPEGSRENALAILSDAADLTVRPVDQVAVVSNSQAYSNLCVPTDSKISVDLLKGEVSCNIAYTKTTTRWYKNLEDAKQRSSDYYWQQNDKYVISAEYTCEGNSNQEFSLSEWNSGTITFR